MCRIRVTIQSRGASDSLRVCVPYESCGDHALDRSAGCIPLQFAVRRCGSMQRRSMIRGGTRRGRCWQCSWRHMMQHSDPTFCFTSPLSLRCLRHVTRCHQEKQNGSIRICTTHNGQRACVRDLANKQEQTYRCVCVCARARARARVWCVCVLSGLAAGGR